MVFMFKNISKNIKPYKFSYAKNIEILVQFSKKILRTLKQRRSPPISLNRQRKFERLKAR